MVITVLTQYHAMLRRNLLHTGVTRGKRLVVLGASPGRWPSPSGTCQVDGAGRSCGNGWGRLLLPLANRRREGRMMSPMPTIPRPGWLEDWSSGDADCADPLSRFDGLAGLEPESMIGRWRGSGLPTGHPLDGVLEAHAWYGKAFESADHVHPLLFRTRSGAVVPLDPTFMPVGVALRSPALARSAPVRMAFAAGRRLLRSGRSAAGLRAVAFRGKRSAAMIYDTRPIVDHFRRIDDDRVLGLMEMRGMERPFFFLLTRDRAPNDGRS